MRFYSPTFEFASARVTAFGPVLTSAGRDGAVRLSSRLQSDARSSAARSAEWRSVANGFRTCPTDFAAIVRHRINYISCSIILRLTEVTVVI